jgi:predicted Zn finger-like uncharacterized protein
MDVRCDRCQTEYELEDASVAAGGASVQCTTCGHTFIVSRRKPDLTPTPSPATDAAAPAWMLTTEEGKVHRFRDATTLQKWIVERRVGRNDRVTAPGASPRRLGDMDELRPFFDLVDQADRAAAARVARPTQPETPQRVSANAGARGQAASAYASPGYASPNYASPNYASPDEDDDDMLMSANARRSRGGVGQRVARLDSDIAANLTMGMDDSFSDVVPQRNIGRKLALGILAAALVAGGFYFGTRSNGSSTTVASASPPASAPAPAPSAPTPPAPAASPPAPAAPSAAAPAAASPPAAAASAHAAAPPAPAPATTAHAAAEEAAAEPVPGTKSASRGGATSDTGGARPRSYEQLVAEANRALENGNTAKAQKYVDEALRQQPSGVAAVTASAYLLLDKRKPLAAVGEFKRALNNSPNFPQALFGLGEAYRSAGDTAQAIEAYKKYLASSPGGEDAPAARRQIRDLESQPARPTHSATATVPEQGSAPPPVPTPAPPP